MITIAPELEAYREHVERIAEMLGLAEVSVQVSELGSFARWNARRSSVIGIDVPAAHRRSTPVEEEIAHEMRHLFQFNQGWVGPYSVILGCYRAEWHGHEHVAFVHTQDEYEALPWEADACAFARAYCAEYLQQQTVAA